MTLFSQERKIEHPHTVVILDCNPCWWQKSLKNQAKISEPWPMANDGCKAWNNLEIEETLFLDIQKSIELNQAFKGSFERDITKREEEGFKLLVTLVRS